MKRFVTVLFLGGTLLVGAVALAGPRDCTRPMADWQPREVVAAKAEEMGLTVARIRTDDGCYKVYGRDAEGRRVEVEFDPATLEVVEYEYHDGHREIRGDREHGERDFRILPRWFGDDDEAYRSFEDEDDDDDDEGYYSEHDDDEEDDDDDGTLLPTAPTGTAPPTNPLIGTPSATTN